MGKKTDYLQTLEGDALTTAQKIFAQGGTLEEAQAAVGGGGGAPRGGAGGGKGKTYVVQPGDSFFSIAGKVYGDQAFAEQLAAANGGDLGGLQPGDTVTLPNFDTSTRPKVSLDFMVEGARAEARLAAADTTGQFRGGFTPEKIGELEQQILALPPGANQSRLLEGLSGLGGTGVTPGAPGSGLVSAEQEAVLEANLAATRASELGELEERQDIAEGAEFPKTPTPSPTEATQLFKDELAAPRPPSAPTLGTQQFKDELAAPPAPGFALPDPFAGRPATPFEGQFDFTDPFADAPATPFDQPIPQPEVPTPEVPQTEEEAVEAQAEAQEQAQLELATSLYPGLGFSEEDFNFALNNDPPLIFFGTELPPGANPNEYFPTPLPDGTNSYIHVSLLEQLETEGAPTLPTRNFTPHFFSPREAGVTIIPGRRGGGRRRRGGGGFNSRRNNIDNRYKVRIGY